jgi:mannose-6-phosphate isomerase-like protein (cupin superfamily)
MGKYLVRKLKEAPQVIHSSCGESMRLITVEDSPDFSFHVVHILDGKRHYHKRSTETYYVLEGNGKLELDGEIVDLEPGMAILIPPGVRHRGYGDFKTIVTGAPAFTPEDEYQD